MADAVQQFLRATRLDRRLDEHEALAAWNHVIGPSLAARARAVRFRGGELVVEVSSSALLQELRNFTGEGHRRAANQHLGEERIRYVTFQPRR